MSHAYKNFIIIISTPSQPIKFDFVSKAYNKKRHLVIRPVDFVYFIIIIIFFSQTNKKKYFKYLSTYYYYALLYHNKKLELVKYYS